MIKEPTYDSSGEYITFKDIDCQMVMFGNLEMPLRITGNLKQHTYLVNQVTTNITKDDTTTTKYGLKALTVLHESKYAVLIKYDNVKYWVLKDWELFVIEKLNY